MDDGGEGEPSFFIRPVGFYQTALTRQLAEAVRINRWVVRVVLDSKYEYNQCKIGRLTIGEEIDKEERMIQEAEVRGYEAVEGGDNSTEEENNSCGRSRVKNKSLQEVQDNNTLRR